MAYGHPCSGCGGNADFNKDGTQRVHPYCTRCLRAYCSATAMDDASVERRRRNALAWYRANTGRYMEARRKRRANREQKEQQAA